MLRIGLTGGLGSGKSTVAGFLRNLGAEIIEADELGRKMMEPGQPVYSEIVATFGSEILNPDATLNRARLAKLAFEGGRLNDLNAIVHPAVIAAQQNWMKEIFARDPSAIAVVESALIFEVVRDAQARGETDSILSNWRRRIDRVIVVTAPDEQKIARYAARLNPSPTARPAIEADARLRLTHQIPDAEKAPQADYVLDNSSNIAHLHAQVQALWPRLKADSNNSLPPESLK